MNSGRNAVLFLIILSIVAVCYFMTSPKLQYYVFKGKCFDCRYYDYNSVYNINGSVLGALNNPSISNVNINYSRFFSKYGTITISYFETLPDGTRIKKEGKSGKIDPSSLVWATFNTLKIGFVNNSLVLEADDDFFKSNQTVFISNLENAFLNSRVKNQ